MLEMPFAADNSRNLLFLSSDSAVQLPLPIYCDTEVSGWISGVSRNPDSDGRG